MTVTHRIFYTEAEDGNILAVHIDSPRFCVAAPTKDEAFSKASRALDYYDSVKIVARKAPPKETRVISPTYHRFGD